MNKILLLALAVYSRGFGMSDEQKTAPESNKAMSSDTLIGARSLNPFENDMRRAWVRLCLQGEIGKTLPDGWAVIRKEQEMERVRVLEESKKNH